MGKKTGVEWCDSTDNELMGCDGCELWNPTRGVRDCYAGVLTSRYAGRPGWAQDFNRPEIFPGRIAAALRWPDLTGTDRPDKPWLNGLPRLIFLDDLSDSFTPSIDPDTWLTPQVPAMAASPHIWIFLTKRARQMRMYFDRLGYVPDNFWLGVTVTSQRTTSRLKHLAAIKAKVKLCSFEPLLGPVDARPYMDKLQWAIIGGASNALFTSNPAWLLSVLDQATAAGVKRFFKQFGALSVNPDPTDPTAKGNGGSTKGGRMVNGQVFSEMPLAREAH